MSKICLTLITRSSFISLFNQNGIDPLNKHVIPGIVNWIGIFHLETQLRSHTVYSSTMTTSHMTH